MDQLVAALEHPGEGLVSDVLSTLRSGLQFTFQNGWKDLLNLISNFMGHLNSVKPVGKDVETALLALTREVIAEAAALHHEESGMGPFPCDHPCVHSPTYLVV